MNSSVKLQKIGFTVKRMEFGEIPGLQVTFSQ